MTAGMFWIDRAEKMTDYSADKQYKRQVHAVQRSIKTLQKTDIKKKSSLLKLKWL